MTQKITITANIETEEDTAFDDLSIENTVGLLGTVKSYRIKYEDGEVVKPKFPGPKLTYDQVKEKFFHKNLNVNTIRTQILSAFITQESEKFHDFAVEAIDEAVLKVEFEEIPDQDQELVTEILNDEYYHEVLAKRELKDKHGIE